MLLIEYMGTRASDHASWPQELRTKAGSPEWVGTGAQDGIQLFHMPRSAKGTFCVKGEGVIRVGMEKVVAACRRKCEYPVYDKYLEACEEMEKEGDLMLGRMQFKAQFPLSAREVFFFEVCHVDENHAVFVWRDTTDTDRFPTPSSRTRATMHLSGFVLERIDAGSTKVTHIVDVDYNGYIPASVMKLITRTIPLLLAEMRKALEKSE